MVKSKTSAHMFSPATPSANLSIATPMTKDIKEQQPSTDDKVLEAAILGLDPYPVRLVQRPSKQNALIISKYILAMNAEVNPSSSHKESQLKTLCFLSDFHKQKPFSEMTRDDVLKYLDSHRRPEEADPLHKWIGTYNLRRDHLRRFFKWLHYPELEQGKRPTPPVVMNIPSFRRKEQSIYKPTDMWSEDDDSLFLKYCPNKRDRCYHMIAHDSSCRPSEILGLKIRSVVFKTNGEYQYAEIQVGGGGGGGQLLSVDESHGGGGGSVTQSEEPSGQGGGGGGGD
jgi:integrase/recombinase XerD